MIDRELLERVAAGDLERPLARCAQRLRAALRAGLVVCSSDVRRDGGDRRRPVVLTAKGRKVLRDRDRS